MSDLYEKSELLKALGHPVRLKIVMGLLLRKQCNCNVGEMVDSLGLPQSTVSQHLGILRSRGIVGVRKEGTRACYRILDKRVEGLVKALNR